MNCVDAAGAEEQDREIHALIIFLLLGLIGK